MDKFKVFLDLVKEEIYIADGKKVHNCRLQIKAFLTATGTTAESPGSHIYRAQLLEAIREENPDKVLALIARGNEENANRHVKTLRNLNVCCKAVAQRQKQRRDLICEEDCLGCSIKKILKRILACITNYFCKAPSCWSLCKQCYKDEQQPTEDQIEEEKQWIEILSNPLYISLEWFCRIYSKSGRDVSREEGDSTEHTTAEAPASAVNEGRDEDENARNTRNEDSLHSSDENENEDENQDSLHPSDENENEDENQDVIASALRDSHLLEMIAGNDLHQHKGEYKKRANEIEEFAVDVIEGSTRDQLIDVLDTKGDGCLKQQKPWNFSQSLSLLKIAADEKRKQSVGNWVIRVPSVLSL